MTGKPTRQGHWKRPNDNEAEAVALDFQQFSARTLKSAFEESGFATAECVPKSAVIALLASHALAPTSNAGQSIAAANRLADIAGLKGGADNTKKALAELRRQMESMRKRKTPTTPRLVGSEEPGRQAL